VLSTGTTAEDDSSTGYLVVNLPAEHPNAAKTAAYVRSEVLLAGTILRPLKVTNACRLLTAEEEGGGDACLHRDSESDESATTTSALETAGDGGRFRTEITTVTSIDPGGGAATTMAGASIVNKLSATTPVYFIRRLEAAAQKDDLDLATAR